MLFSILMFFFTGCDDDIYVLNSAYWNGTSVVSALGGNPGITISGKKGALWIAKVVEGSDWCSFSKSNLTLSEVEGFITDGDNELNLYCRYNYQPEEREAKISLTFDGKDTRILTLVQTPAFKTFTETPSYKDQQDYQYVTHFATLNNRLVRNFSLCFDKSKNAALWVAYPLHPTYLGSAGRTNEWAFDPFVNNYFQANCVLNSYNGSFDRGHQLPSADRLANRELNLQTFYMTNITPQLNRLNQDMWANLEIKVRSNNCADTLFVVTGAYFDENSTSTTFDGSGKRVALPTHYFKVLLRTISGSTGKAVVLCEDEELKSIGFWVEHKSYGDIQPPRTISRSVAEIEALTGFEFFPNISHVVKNQNNPVQWGL